MPLHDVLDNPVWAAPTGPHASCAEVHGQAARYRSDITVFAALAAQTDPAAWQNLAELLGPGHGHRGARRRRCSRGRLVTTVVAGIRARGETPFLHTTATNTSAIRLYESRVHPPSPPSWPPGWVEQGYRRERAMSGPPGTAPPDRPTTPRRSETDHTQYTPPRSTAGTQERTALDAGIPEPGFWCGGG
ncbi:hypothetical protein Franean1_6861 [Parafrankia sp. EAN1pec]|uniref:GNAT family N-acetyltransferase n=1 Tax=Parafrankia sp. (strain EAN1pec) TaxID=298653 RepID=UPI00005434FA|nr:hypothetical protein Franean1_6861 [Frankia sp. EAN1pec]